MLRSKTLSFLAPVLLTVLPLISLAEESGTFQLGWVGALSGPHVKYGSGQAALLAEEDINAEGGVLRKRLQLVMEDGQGKGAPALSAFQKLVNFNHLKFIVGGSCSPETGAIAPLAEKAGVVLLASVSSSPKFTNINPNFFRVTAPSVGAGDIVGAYAVKRQVTRLGIVQEETDYVLPVAARVKEVFEASGGTVVDVMSFTPAESDFRSILTKLRMARIDGLYIGAQSKDTARLVMRQIPEVGLKVLLMGNEQVGNGAIDDPSYAKLFEGLVFAEPMLDPNAPKSKVFIEKFKKRYNVENLPTGFWTAEAYDAVRLMAKVINDCGPDVQAVKNCLLKVKDYPGVSGPITINHLHDGVRNYLLKRVGGDGKPVPLE